MRYWVSNISRVTLLLWMVVFRVSTMGEQIVPFVDPEAIHKQILTIDSHTDTPLLIVNRDFKLDKRHDWSSGGGRLDIPRMKEGGLDAVFFAVFIGQDARDRDGYVKAFTEADRIFNRTLEEIQRIHSKASLALTPDDIRKLNSTGKIAILIGLENGYMIGKDLNKIKYFYDKGARYMTLCHSKNNDICDSSTDEAEHNGLSEFGRQVVREMNRLGMMIDVSHISDAAFYEVISLSTAPVIASHSNARAVCNHPRNLSDDMLRAIARNGGVVQVCLLNDYVKKMPPNPEREEALALFRKKYGDLSKLNEEQRREARRQWREINRRHPPNLPSVADLVDHIDHIVKVAGINHVGIGSDFDGGGALADCPDVSAIPAITYELLRRGYHPDQIQKIWGGNLLRVMEEVQKAAR